MSAPIDPTSTSAWAELSAIRDSFSPDLRGWFAADATRVARLSLPLADHYFTREADRLTLLQSIEAFLAKHNPADGPPSFHAGQNRLSGADGK